MLAARRAARGVALLLAGLAMGGCSLILDFSGSIHDAGPVDGNPAADASARCGTDEPNDALAMAVAIEAGPRDAAVCPAGDHDFYGFSLDGTQDLAVDLTFAGESGARDLELQLYDVASAMVLTLSTGLDDDEHIEQSGAQGNRLPAGSYAIEIFGRDDQVENDYHLDVAISAPGT
jgi:hypothetical protein